MNINKGDFLVVEVAGKRHLMKVREQEGKEVTGLNQKMKRSADGRYEKKLPFTVRKSNIIVNLGKAPMPGTVYGVKIEPLYRRETTNTCGDILFFVDFDDKLVARTKKSLIKTYKKLKAKNLGGVPAEIEIRKAEGKYAGYYSFLPKAENDVLCIKPNFEMMTPSDLDYVIAHEYAHGIWFRMMRPDNIAKWIALYDKHMALTSVGEEDLQEVLNEVTDAGSVRAYMKECDEETLLIVKAALRHIRSVHGVDRKHLDMLLRHSHPIEEYWPEYVEFSEKNVMVSEYAQKSPEELFAEAFAFWFTGKNLPTEVRKLLDRSLSQLVKGRVNGDEEETTDPDAD